MEKTTTISVEMQAAVGRELRRTTSFPVAESDIRRWAIAVYYPEKPPAHFVDAEAARRTRHAGIVAPRDFNPFAWMAASTVETPVDDPLDPDNTEHRLGIAGPGLKFQLNGGLEATYGEHVSPGDVITSVTRLASYREREGRLGLMLFTDLEDTWTNQLDQVVKTNTMTLIRY